MTTPLTWIFYGLALAVSALALRPERESQWTVTAFLVAVVLIGVLSDPTTSAPRQQTTSARPVVAGPGATSGRCARAEH